MRDVCSLIWLALIGLFRSRASLQAEILTLRHQLNVLRRKSPQRLGFTSIDRLVFAGLYRLAPGVLDALKIVRPETVIRWHRAGFRAYWISGGNDLRMHVRIVGTVSRFPALPNTRAKQPRLNVTANPYPPPRGRTASPICPDLIYDRHS
jgi:hypothetical protein